MTLSTDAVPEASQSQATPRPNVPPAPFTLDALRLATVAAGLGLLASFAVIWRGVGLNVAVLTAAGVVALFALAAVERVRPAWRSVWLVAPLLFFAVAVAWRANPFIQFLNVAAVIGLTILLAKVFTRPDLFTQGVGGYLTLALGGLIQGSLLQPGEALLAASRQSRSTSRSPWLWSLARGLLLAAPVVLVLTALLAVADLAFGQSVRDVLKALGLDDLGLVAARLVFAVIAAWSALGYLTLALRQRTTPADAGKAHLWSVLGFTEVAVVLVSVNALFLAFGIFQARYLFGGEANITEAGFTYADYARRGFGELVAVALIVLALGLLLQRLTSLKSGVASLGFKLLTVLLVLQTGVLLASAFTRMRLYEEAYGFTELRVLTQVFMIWLAVVLVAYAITVLLDRPRLIALGGLIATMGFIATLDLINLDGLIAHENIQRDLLEAVTVDAGDRRYGDTFDYLYVLSLSDDAVPELIPLLSHPDPDVRAEAQQTLSDRRVALEATWIADGFWSWSWARQEALRALGPK